MRRKARKPKHLKCFVSFSPRNSDTANCAVEKRILCKSYFMEDTLESGFRAVWFCYRERFFELESGKQTYLIVFVTNYLKFIMCPNKYNHKLLSNSMSIFFCSPYQILCCHISWFSNLISWFSNLRFERFIFWKYQLPGSGSPLWFRPARTFSSVPNRRFHWPSREWFWFFFGDNILRFLRQPAKNAGATALLLHKLNRDLTKL